MKKFFKNESGQSLVLVALSLVVLLGFAAFGIDAGQVHFAQIDMQDAADAAAISGANQLPSAADAKTIANLYAIENGAEAGTVKVTTPYKDDPSMIKVECSTTVPSFFGKVLGASDRKVTASSVARKNRSIWAGEALPFLNLDDDYTKVNTSTGEIKIEVWEPTGPGDFESIWKDDRKYSDAPIPHFDIDYKDGISIEKGVDASIKTQIQKIYNYCENTGDTVYVFSLRKDVIESRKYDNDVNKQSLKNKTVIPLEDLVLLEVRFDAYDFQGGSGASLKLTVLGEYDFNAGEIPEKVTYNAYGGTASIIE